MSKVEIYYFTGTGNSLYAARELQKRIPEAELIPLVRLLGNDVIKTNGETVGFVFPIHMATVPIPVRDFISKLNLESAKYIFAIATRIGTTHSAFDGIDKILKKSGRRLDSYFSLNMPSNDPKFKYKVPTEKDIAELESMVCKRLDSIKENIIKKEANREKDTNFTARIPLVGLFSYMSVLTENQKDNHYCDSKCKGCGTCENVCPSQKIKMVDGKPSWQEGVKCYRCSACLNYCPTQSVQLRSFTEKNGRYSHPYAAAEDIADQKVQR